jgi:CheY-like chemotaxis protein
MTPLQIVLVEDNRSDAHLIEDIITDTKVEHQLTWLRDGEEAIIFFEQGGKADYLILDLNLPKVNGHEVLRYLKAHDGHKKVPVIVMTGSTSPQDLTLVRERGVKCYLVKPMTISEIDQMVVELASLFANPNDCGI